MVRVTVTVVVVPVQPKLLLNRKSSDLTRLFLIVTVNWSRLVDLGYVAILVVDVLLRVNVATGTLVTVVLR